jgi:hypothetical protein
MLISSSVGGHALFLLSCEGVKILTVTNVNNRRRLFLINVFVLTICKFTNRQNETNNFKISYFFMKKFYNKIYVVILEFDVQTVLSYLTI